MLTLEFQDTDGRFQSGDAGIDSGQPEELRVQLPAVQETNRLGLGDREGGKAVLARGKALEKLCLRGNLSGRQLLILRGQGEEPGRGGADRPKPGLGKAPLPQKGHGAVHRVLGGAGPVGLVQSKEDFQAGVRRQLVQQGNLRRGVQPGGVQNAKPEVCRAAQVLRQSGQQSAPSRAGNSKGQFLNGSELLHGKYLLF